MAPKKATAAAAKATDSQIASKYKKLSHRDHVLQKHGMYIGSIEKDQVDVWLLNEPGDRMEKRRIEYVPGLFKIFDEIVGNAIDHSIRQKDTANPVKSIKVTIDQETGVISVTNDGDGIEVVKHPEHDIYVPELIFGNLLTSTNYEEDAERLVQGTNGIGCKACNIFSSWFEIETIDAERGLKYKQRFEDNMSIIKKPSVTKAARKPYTTITFLPDYKRFGMLDGLTPSMYEVMRKRTYDACAVTGKGVGIFFNGSKIDVPTFEKYVDLYLGPKADHTRVHEIIDDRWEVVASYNDFGGFEQVSFVNGILTIKGGKHVDYIMGQIVKKITELITKKHKEANIKPHTIKDNLIIFIKCTISNPTFDSQTKETLTTAATKFGSKPEVSAAFVTKLFKSGIEQKIMDLSAINNDKTLKKTDGKKSNTVRGIVKLEDAAWAGGPKSQQCTLILTEGDSAATMAIAGLVEVGRERYGVFPLKGKVMNVKDATIKKISENDEINNIKKILGLESGKAYDNPSELRYGRLMLMTDSDSVSGDTPLLLQDPATGYILLKTIQELTDEPWYFVGSREYSSSSLLAWTDIGWTQIKHVMRHYTTKRMYRIVTPRGCVDVTEDHSLLDENANMVRPGDLEVGNRLLHAFPSWLPMTSTEVHTIDDEIRRVPDFILNGDKYTRQKFLEAQSFSKTGDKFHACELYYLARSIGMNPTLDCDEDGIYEVKIDSEREACEPSIASRPATITKIIDLGTTTQYVYDLETDNHHFQAGIGELIVHNTDGSHIKGLVFNLFHSMWPTLVRDPSSLFMTSMLTPIIKARKGAETLSFYTLTDYDRWYASAHNPNSWKIKYYKGLGTSTNAEAREYFKDMRTVTYKFDGEPSDKSMNLAFNKKLADERKTWLTKYDKDNILDYTQPQVSYDEFVDKELIHFSNYDLERSLPSMCDGLKISQRKIMYACFKRPSLANEEIKVAQLAGYVSETAAYHHGEASLQQAIVGLAQDFVGSNNLNLLQPRGQFGCLDPETDILLWNGTTAKAKDIATGDELIGDDGQKRTVLNTTSGIDEMYEICIEDGSSYKVNSEHILTLDLDGEIVDVKLTDLLKSHTSNRYKSIRNTTCIEWDSKQTRLQLLADSIDAHGVVFEGNVFRIASFNKDLEFIARSLGFTTSWPDPVVLEISGCGIENIPTCNVKLEEKGIPSAGLTFNIKPLGPGPFNGWQVDGNERFLLGDWTITHNSRGHGGHDASQPRYIFTQLAPTTPLIFCKDDAPTLTYCVDDGQKVEPEFYMPIVPMVLINGAIGIGTGFSTNIPCYNPKEIVQILKSACGKSSTSLDASAIKLEPWYAGFTGEIRPNGPGKFISLAKWKREGETKIHITELPVGTWTHDFKETCEKLLDEMPSEFKKYENRSAERIDITLHFTAVGLQALLALEPNGFTKLENKFGLVSSKGLSTTNMYAFNTANQITKFAEPGDIMAEFYKVRLEYYQKRKDHMLAALEANATLLENKKRFIKAVVTETLKVHTLKKAELEATLAKAPAYAKHDDTYDYLTRIPIYNLTKDKVDELEAEFTAAKAAATKLKGRTIHALWLQDLEALEKKMH